VGSGRGPAGRVHPPWGVGGSHRLGPGLL